MLEFFKRFDDTPPLVYDAAIAAVQATLGIKIVEQNHFGIKFAAKDQDSIDRFNRAYAQNVASKSPTQE